MNGELQSRGAEQKNGRRRTEAGRTKVRERGQHEPGELEWRFQTEESGGQKIYQLQATGVEVVGSDGKKVGDLKEVDDADFLVTRRLRRDIRVPVNRIREVTSEVKIVLDLPADEAQELGRGEPSSRGDPMADFSENSRQERGAWGLRREE